MYEYPLRIQFLRPSKKERQNQLPSWNKGKGEHRQKSLQHILEA